MATEWETVMLAAILGNIAVSLWNRHVWGEVDKLIDRWKKKAQKRFNRKNRKRKKK